MNHPMRKPLKRSKIKSHYNSTPHALYHRSSYGSSSNVYSRTDFLDDVSSYRQGPSGMSLLHDPQIVSPHIGAVTSIDVNSDDNSCNGRFMLVGSRDCTISAYDLSRLGSEYYFEDKVIGDIGGGFAIGESRKRARRKPIARSKRLQASEASRGSNLSYVGLKGHRHSVVSVQWYPVDTGMFISVENNGLVHLWDSNEFLIVESFRARSVSRGLSNDQSSDIQSAVLPRNIKSSHMLIACGCGKEGKVKLCDITSGSFSHELVGHAMGESINSLAWSPSDEYILASCSSDCTVRVWDIRKTGSAACLMILDGERSYFELGEESNLKDGEINPFMSQGSIGLGYNGLSYEMLREVAHGKLAKLPEQYRYIVNNDSLIGPNNFHKSESSLIKSHDGAVTSICFTPDGQYIVSAGCDARLKIWDLRFLSGVPVPTVYLGVNGKTFCRETFNRSTKNSLSITQGGSSRTTTIWCGDELGNLLGKLISISIRVLFLYF